MKIFSARKVAGAVSLSGLLIFGPQWARAGSSVELVDVSKPGLLPKASVSDYATTYDVITDRAYKVELIHRIPGKTRPPIRHRAMYFSLNLTEGKFLSTFHPDGDGLINVQPGQMLTTGDPNRIYGSVKLLSGPSEALAVYSPPLPDEDVPLTEAEAYGRAHRNKKDLEQGNARNILDRVKLGSKPFSEIPLFQKSGAKKRIRPSLVILAKPYAWASARRQEVLWMPVEGQARVEFEGKILIAKPETVIRIPIGYASKVTITPLGGRFAAVVLGLGE